MIIVVDFNTSYQQLIELLEENQQTYRSKRHRQPTESTRHIYNKPTPNKTNTVTLANINHTEVHKKILKHKTN